MKKKKKRRRMKGLLISLKMRRSLLSFCDSLYLFCFLFLYSSSMLNTIFLFYRIITVRVLKEKERETEIGDVTLIDTGI